MTLIWMVVMATMMISTFIHSFRYFFFVVDFYAMLNRFFSFFSFPLHHARCDDRLYQIHFTLHDDLLSKILMTVECFDWRTYFCRSWTLSFDHHFRYMKLWFLMSFSSAFSLAIDIRRMNSILRFCEAYLCSIMENINQIS